MLVAAHPVDSMPSSLKVPLRVMCEVQGRKWLSKSGGASSSAAAMAAPSILPKGGGAIAPPAPPLLTPHCYISIAVL